MPRNPATHVGALVKVDGVTLPCDPDQASPLSGLKVTWGREDKTAVPSATTCDFQVVDTTGATYPKVVKFNSRVEVWAVPPDGGANVLVFGGRVNDLRANHDGDDVVMAVTAVDPTANFSTVMVGAAPWPIETVLNRQNRIMAAIGGDSVFSWPPLPSTKIMTEVVYAMDVDNQSAWDLIHDLVWGIGVAPWPVDVNGVPGIIFPHATEFGLSLADEDPRASRRIPVADFTGAADPRPATWPTVCLDACDIDLEGVAFTANPGDVKQVIRVTWGPGDEGAASGVAVNRPPGSQIGARVFDVASWVNNEDDARDVALRWQGNMTNWISAFGAPWAVGALRLDPDTVTGMDDFHLAMLRMLEQTTRPYHGVLLQLLPAWAPWRDAQTGDPEPNLVGYLQGGTYTYEDGRWVLDLAISVEGPLSGALAPEGGIVVSPGDVVSVNHDDPKVVADPQTRWLVGEVATFADGQYGWDGAAWVRGGVKPIAVQPGDVVGFPHDDDRTRPDPTTPWAARTYATFSDGKWQWNGSAWVAMVTVRYGATVALPHDAPNVLPDPTTAWGNASAGQYATFSDGRYRWGGSAWAAVILVGNGANLGVPHTDPNLLPSPITSWSAGNYATFTDGTYRWSGNTWQAMITVKPGGTTTAASTDPRLVPDPKTAWTQGQWATFSNGIYQWNGSAWVATIAVAPGGKPSVPHTDARVRPNPATAWTLGQYATFTDGTYTWDGEAWVAVLVVKPGNAPSVPHDDASVVPDPATAWTLGQYATFADGTYAWNGSAWSAVLVVKAGDTVDVPHTDPTVVPSPTSAWSPNTYATFSDGLWRWDGTAWVEGTEPATVVEPYDVVDVPHTDPGLAPTPATTWRTLGAAPYVFTYATFTDGTYAWGGSNWQPIVVVEPGGSTPDSVAWPTNSPQPTTEWPTSDWATFPQGTFRWDGTAWVFRNTNTAWQGAPEGTAWSDVPTGTSWTEWNGGF